MTSDTAKKMVINHGLVPALVATVFVVCGAVVVPRMASAQGSAENIRVATPPLTPAEVAACRGPRATASWFDDEGWYITVQPHFQGWRVNEGGELLDAAGHIVPAGTPVLIDVRTNTVIDVVKD
ncbi:MAG: hypothetical protein AAGI30_02345 [Planctomycetota bacterium]